MKRLAAIAAFVLTASGVVAASRDAEWQAVEDAIRNGLPRTAITNLNPIITGALRDKAWGEATKAIARKIVLEGNIQGNKPEEKVTRLEAEIAKAPKEIVPLLDTILAEWYWQYYSQNRWRFIRRTQTGEAPGKDFTSWDLPRLFREIDRQFQKALANADTLKKLPVSDFDQLLTQGTLPDRYRPTLYDFIAHEALSFYSSGEQAGATPEDAVVLSADEPIYGVIPLFGTPDQFTSGKIERRADESSAEKALFLYRDLLNFHHNDADSSAFADADLARLVWANNVASGETKNARYKEALKSFVERNADHELSAMALHDWARVLQGENDLVEAHRLAERGAATFPSSPGAGLCRNLLGEIEAKSAGIQTEHVWNAPWPEITVTYRNVTNVYFRAVAWDWNDFLNKSHGRPEYLNQNDLAEVLSKQPALEWSAPLPATSDYKQRTANLTAPTQLKAGFYFILASHRSDFGETDNQVSYADVWVSNLALVIRPRDANVEGFVLEANSGEPVTGAEIKSWSLDNQGNRVAGPSANTDENGFFSITSPQGRGYLIRARHNGRELATQQEFSSYRSQRERPEEQTVFFTDRAIYRPGQTIQYKGICLRVERATDNYSVLGRRELTVIFSDVNNKEIARLTHRCNDYGSFSGSFTAPRDRLMGAMSLRVINGPVGQTMVRVEEYKRPKFQVTLDAPKTPGKLGEKVELDGHAMSYTGAAIDGAKVTYRVVREVRWPIWWGWYRPWRMQSVSASQEIAHGTAITGTDGSFKINFVAKPDPKVSETDEASFNFAIYADVTDNTGETRSAQRGVLVGFAALSAALNIDDWQTSAQPVELTIRTTTLDDEPQSAEGTLKIYRLKEPDVVHRPRLTQMFNPYANSSSENSDPSDPNSWPLGEVVFERGFATDTNGTVKISVPQRVGVYRAVLETQDRFGKKVTAQSPIRVLDPSSARLGIRIPHFFAAPTWTVEPGADFMALWGTGYDSGRAFVEVEHRNRMITRYWTKPGDTQQQIKQAVTEAMRGGFTVHVTQIRENRAYLDSHHIDVPWSNKELEVKWEHFTSKLEPSQKETWTAAIQIRNPKSEIRNAEKAVAEMVATLYDASLDQFAPLQWLQRFNIFRQDFSTANAMFQNIDEVFKQVRRTWNTRYETVELSYRAFPRDITANYWGSSLLLRRGRVQTDGFAAEGRVLETMVAAPTVGGEAKNETFFNNLEIPKQRALHTAVDALAERGGTPPNPQANGPDLNQVSARKNLNETAFFFPQLVSDTNGVVRMTFTMPEALTEWRFLGFAHDKSVRSGFLDGKAVTSKEIMVQPNPPRFVREGDHIEFTVKVSNQSDARQNGKVRLTFSEAFNSQASDKSLGNTTPELSFEIPPKESRTYSWKIGVPDEMGFLTYKAVASTGKVSDGEEGFLPVLSRRIMITESLPLTINGPATKHFKFEKLLQSGHSGTIRNLDVTVQMVSNPSWYAVLALPYLMEFPHECTEQTFNRLYANALARHIAGSDPKIHRVFEQWRGTPALDSPLEKNQDLKAVALEETPWLRQAHDESQARRNVGVLFDDNRLNSETTRTLQKLVSMQLEDGSWPWFPGGRGNDYITLYITTGFGRLRRLGVDVNVDAAVRSLVRLDTWMDEHYHEILKSPEPEKYVPSAMDAMSLYGRSFFLKDRPVAKEHQAAVDFFLARAREHWLKVADRQSQGHLAIALKRFAEGGASTNPTPRDIMKSLKERSVTNEEMGRFWRDTELSWWWYRAPIETQALMIEAFDEVMSDAQAVEECKVWLLKQKQTQDWKTTKATADAVYALLLRGKDLLSSDRLVEVKLGGVVVTPSNIQHPASSVEHPESSIQNRASSIQPSIEAGTGFYEKRFMGSEIKPALGDITVKKQDTGVTWGSVHWQYLEDMSKVTPYEGTPLKLKKSLFTKRNTSKGPTLEPVTGTVNVGDELVVRIELRVDRDMEYVHLKDQRGSGTEPVNAISHYRYQDGLAYYESTRDTASHFFIDYLPKGTYVFEYSTRVQLRGEYQTGVAEIQCMYAPEFNSHSASPQLTVK